MILFLDFDGVLHPIPSHDKQFFSCLPRLEALLREFPKVQIVISSMWRADGVENLLRYFSEDIRPRIIGGTPWSEVPAYAPDSEFILGVVRHSEILAWIAENNYAGPWVALDDSWREFPAGCEELIVCPEETGFGDNQERALRARLGDWSRDEH